MTRSRGLRRLWRHPYVFVAAVILFACGLANVGGTFASWTAQTENRTAAFAGGWIGPPTNPIFNPSGTDASLIWTPGTHGGVTGEHLYGQNNLTSSTCSGSGYPSITTMAAANTTMYTDSHGSTTTTTGANMTATQTSMTVTSAANFPSSGTFVIFIGTEQLHVTGGAGTTTWTVTRGYNGTTAAIHNTGSTVMSLSAPYWCYQLASTSTTYPNWTASANFPAQQAGLVATGLAIHEATIGTLTTNDTIVVTYNQQPSLTGSYTNATKACAATDASKNLFIFLKYGTCATTNTSFEVKITGLSGTTASKTTNQNLTSVTVSTSAPWTVTYKIGGNMTTNVGTYSGTTATALIDTGVKSAATTDQAIVCTDPGYGCLPTAAQTN